MLYVLALLIGVIAGLRAMTAPAAVAWGAYLGWLPLAGTWASFMGHWIAVGIFTVLALVELVTDQLPSTPSRKVPMQFGARLVSGALSGAAIGAAGGALIGGADRRRRRRRHRHARRRGSPRPAGRRLRHATCPPR